MEVKDLTETESIALPSSNEDTQIVEAEKLIVETALQEEKVEEESSNGDKTPIDENKKNVFDIFAWIGFFTGIAVLITSCVGFGLFVFWIGIVFSCIGKKSIKNKKKADYGLLFSIFALVVTIALFLFV